MIGYLKGEVLEVEEGKLLIGVGAESAVGYSVQVPASYGALPVGAKTTLYIYTHVREDSLDLYGFLTKSEKELFLAFLSVTGIGPKGALGLLSKSEPAQLIQAILEGDKEFLTSLPGVGKKTAERVVLELKDPISKKVDSGIFKAAASPRKPGEKAAAKGPLWIIQDAKSALVGLGYREQDVTALLERVMAESETPPAKAEDLVRTALKSLGMNEWS